MNRTPDRRAEHSTSPSETPKDGQLAKLPLLALLLSLFVFAACNGDLGSQGSSSNDKPGCGGSAIDCQGACIEASTDPLNCGSCGVACATGEYCEMGACIGFCAPGELECAGLCTVTASDVANCGACGSTCPAGQFCDAGVCSATCSGSLCTNASAVQECAHLDSNNDHCGACGAACADGQACQAGTCVDVCPPGRAACGAGCVDVRTDAANCGACGVACGAGVACVEGACGGGEPVCLGAGCGCAAGQLDCNNVCIDAQTNLLHCGACGVECAPGQQCVAGACQCPAGGTLCAAGCTDTMSDNANCGACGQACVLMIIQNLH